VHIAATGFAAGESLTIVPSTFLTLGPDGSGGAFTNFVVGSDGSTGTETCATSQTANSNGAACDYGFVASRPGGAVTVLVFGGSSGLTASATFTITPSIALAPGLGYSGAQTTFVLAPTAGTSYLVGHNFAAATPISANSLTLGGVATIHGTVTTDNNGAFAPFQFTYTNSLPLGQISAVFNATTFSFANSNIFPTATIETADVANSLAPAGAFIVSASSSPAYFTTDASSYTYQSTAYIFGVGLTAGGAVTATWTPPTGTPTTPTVSGANPAADGGFFGFLYKGIGDGYGANNVLALGGAAVNAPTLALTETPKITAPSSSSTQRFGSTPTLTVRGFKQDSTFAVTIGGVTWASIAISSFGSTPTCTPACGSGSSALGGTFTVALPAMPAVAGGSQTLSVTGTTTGNAASGSRTVGIVVDTGSMSLGTGIPGQVVSLVTSSLHGIHGLLASTAYTIMWDGPSGTSVATFTSTAAGTIPAATQLTVPAGASGTHFVDIVTAGASVVYGKIATSGIDQYTNLEFVLASAGTATPSAGNVGNTVSVAAQGLAPSTGYTLQIGGIAYASFTASATGSIPAGTTFVFPRMASTTESGTSVSINVVNSASGTTDAVATFLLQANIALNMTTAPAGHSVTLTGQGLIAGQGYNVIWNAAYTGNGLTSGTVIGAFTAAADGSATSAFTVPAGATGGTSYLVQLYRVGDSIGTAQPFRLVSGASLTVGVAATSGIGTSTLTASGTPSKSTTGPTPAITASFTNTFSSSLSVYMWVQVTNAQGQSVGVLAGGATIGAGQTVSIPAPITLPSGSYTGVVFCTTSNGVVISTNSASFTFTV